jgi:predicted MPP superfamily phosphohydrolase
MAGGVAAGLVAAGAAASALTWDSRAITHPRYEGLLTIAPSVVGNVEDIVGNFGKYREELAKIVTNVSRLYDVTSTLPTYSPGPGTVRVLFVSDIHLNPAAYSVMQSVATQFATDFVGDTGDLTDHGSAAEDRFTDLISTMGQPYVFVRGNHDSRQTQRAVARQRNAVVLDNGEVKQIDGLRISGMGDPRFTPDKDTRDDPTAGADAAKADAFAERIRAEVADGHPVQIALIHDVTMAPQLDGLVPLILSGHIHRRNVSVLEQGTLSMQQGSTGGAGLRGLEHEQPTPIELSVLYFDRASGALRAWDDVTVGGLGLSSAKIERHLADQVGAPSSDAGAS